VDELLAKLRSRLTLAVVIVLALALFLSGLGAGWCLRAPHQ